ncbi:MAG: hypothetical protein A2445_02420 [Candidatus Jacksonbacteria bacterium RIFOXYC2_FULL_44_29]|nr:MAG: hypothetical protein UW45_C0020G0010 [Parcubacteria group bacterium GW2011_GWC2_44_22]OGY74475.1 MAG: hypothetical protein A2240_02680 [Candidatus Jacksonbacteria bacterium RIFOXYA2_FULL_43_12]OGY77383.1 MAG: hypothetical protein A2295_01630 [Candidatus Jacksonbacteria bacterium RIFOXYB2_FULL_44_15]OGY78155.1 MAG: hypothetical protein A2550_05975 [Candidatus Jacksonbacteria bacterium RIFOXYD2_FULL_43_21]OGY80731.1 MAG: hypothetical protein A2445_02420 [Candidatus Jacksonbacteria bacteri
MTTEDKEEFCIYWNAKNLTEEYLGIKSEEQRINFFEKWEIPLEYKEEADRQSWLDMMVHQDYNKVEFEKPASKNIKEIKERVENFISYLEDFNFCDFEKAIHIGVHIAYLTVTGAREGIKKKSILKEFLIIE